MATTLERLARDGKAGFYRGPVAEAIAGFLEAQGGHLRVEDFVDHTSTCNSGVQYAINVEQRL